MAPCGRLLLQKEPWTSMLQSGSCPAVALLKVTAAAPHGWSHEMVQNSSMEVSLHLME